MKHHILRSCATFLVLTVTAVCAAGDGMTPRQVAELHSISSAVIAPDGSRIAALRSVPRTLFEGEDGSAWAELLMVDPTTGAVTPFVTGEVNVSSVQWLPDSSAVSYLAKRDGDEKTSLYLIPVAGGESRRLLAMETSIAAYSWSPDGRRVAVIADKAKCAALQELEEQGFDQEIFDVSWQPRQVSVAEVAKSAEPAPVALALDGSAFQVRWSPDGAHLAVALAPSPLVDDRYMFQRVHVIDVESGEVKAKVNNPGKLGTISWSPDGSKLAMISGADLNDPAAGSLLVAPVSGGAPANLTGDFEGHVQSVAWRDPESLLFLADVGEDTALYRISEDGSNLKSIDWAPAGAVFTSMTASRDGSRLALVGEAPNHPGEAFIASPGDEGPRRLTVSNPWLADVALARQTTVRHSARDGLELGGVLVYPLDFRKGARYPLVMVVHGGPEGHRRNGWLTNYSSPAQVLAARGFAVFFPNYRGSTGRGVAFCKLGQKDPAGKEFDDLVDAVDHLIEVGLVDRDRVGVTGGSYGGYATAWLSTRYSDRFAAGVMFVGISNKISKTGTTEIPEEEFLVHALQRPHDNFDFYLERSPIFYAEKAETPLLILHGKEDPRVHPGQSLEMYRAVKAAGDTPVRLVLYPGEKHGNRRAAARYDYSLRMLRWMERYLMGPGGEMPHHKLDYRSPEHGWPEEAADPGA